MWVFGLALSLVTVAAAVKGVYRHSNPQRLLTNALEANPEWQKYFASPIGSTVHHPDEGSVGSSQTAPPQEDTVEEGPGHARVVAPHLQAVIQGRDGKGIASSGSSRSKSKKKGKNKSKSKHAAGSEYDDDFFDYMNEAETSDEANNNEAKGSQSKSLKKKVSKASGDREVDCHFMNGVYFGKDCEESKFRRTEQADRWMPWNMKTHYFSVLFVCLSGQRSKLHKHESNSPSPVPAPHYPPSYVSPKPIYISPAAVPHQYERPAAPSAPTVSTPGHNGTPTRPVYDEAPAEPVAPVALVAPTGTTGPVGSPVGAPVSSVATPSSEGVSTTLAPVQGANETATASPTSAPAIGIVATPTSAYKTKTVTPKAALIRVTGTFDPEAQDEEFFDVLRDNFAPYTRASIGEMLTSFDLKAEFIVPNEKEVKSAVRTSWIEVIVSYYIGTDDMLLFDAFTTESGSVVLTKFFQSANAQRLIQRLKDEGIPVVSIEVHSTLSDDETASAKEGGEESDNQTVPSVSLAKGQTEEDSRSGIIAASVSGAIILLVIGVVLLKRRQSHTHAVFDDKGSVTSDYSRTDVYSGTPGGMYLPSETTSYVKPAALHVRNKKERDIGVKARLSSNSTISSYQSNGTTNAERADKKNRKKVMLQPEIDDKSEIAADDESRGQADTKLVPYADGSDCDGTGRALKCLDGEESVGAMNDAYPEFDLYHTAGLAPPSPGWSIGNFSSMSRQYGIAGDDGEYSTSRKRWHEEANDLDLIALPDHCSETGYASTNGDDRSQSSTKSKGRCSI